jgi:hypothetical protein
MRLEGWELAVLIISYTEVMIIFVAWCQTTKKKREVVLIIG